MNFPHCVVSCDIPPCLAKTPERATIASGSVACPASSMNKWVKWSLGNPADANFPAVTKVTTMIRYFIRVARLVSDLEGWKLEISMILSGMAFKGLDKAYNLKNEGFFVKSNYLNSIRSHKSLNEIKLGKLDFNYNLKIFDWNSTNRILF